MANVLADALLDAARRDPTTDALREPAGVRWTRADLLDRSAQYANALVRSGIAPGDRVAVHSAARAEIVALHLGVLRAGAVYVPMNSAYTAREVGALTADAGAALVVTDDGAAGTSSLAAVAEHADTLPAAFDDVSRDAADLGSILYTSGTTGSPKGAALSHANLAWSARTLSGYWRMTHADTLLHTLPLFHVHGLFVAVHCTLVTGGAIVMLDRFAPDGVIDHLPEATVLMGVPTHYTRLLASTRFDRRACAGVRLFTSGSAPMLATTHEAFTARTGHHIVERYGMTETNILTSIPVGGPYRPGTVGRALPGQEVRIAAPAEGSSGTAQAGPIEVRGPNVFGGYWGRPDLQETEFTPDGWFRTGDLGMIHDDGFVEIVGRAKDLIITGGLNVYPKEVELVLDALPGVDESAVIGIAHPDFGETVVAVVTARPGHVLDGEAIRAQARNELAAFKVPKRVVVVDALPRNAMGKVEKAKLRATYG